MSKSLTFTPQQRTSSAMNDAVKEVFGRQNWVTAEVFNIREVTEQ